MERHEDLDTDDLRPGDVIVSYRFVRPDYDYRFVVDRAATPSSPTPSAEVIADAVRALMGLTRTAWGGMPDDARERCVQFYGATARRVLDSYRGVDE